jgi:hypothetical protein
VHRGANAAAYSMLGGPLSFLAQGHVCEVLIGRDIVASRAYSLTTNWRGAPSCEEPTCNCGSDVFAMSARMCSGSPRLGVTKRGTTQHSMKKQRVEKGGETKMKSLPRPLLSMGHLTGSKYRKNGAREFPSTHERSFVRAL